MDEFYPVKLLCCKDDAKLAKPLYEEYKWLRQNGRAVVDKGIHSDVSKFYYGCIILLWVKITGYTANGFINRLYGGLYGGWLNHS